MMKKIVIIAVIISLVVAGTLAAQGFARPNVETRTINGTLAITNGFITMKAGDETYYVHGFQHLIGFVDGLKEGAQLSLEGYIAPTFANTSYPNFFATKMTLNGKDYDLSTPYGNGYGNGGMMYGNGYGNGYGGRGGMHHGGGFGRGGYGHGRGFGHRGGW